VNLTDLNNALGTVNASLPILVAAYTGLKAIWLRMNPQKTEADYLAYLQDSAQRNIDDSAAILTADGYVQQADGSWKKP
jgi:hypothetical protein